MEQDVKIGEAGAAKFEESLASEKASAELKVGPLKLTIEAEVSNADLLALVASKVPAGFAHDGIVMLAKELGVALPEAAPAAPSA
jgi:hypothetical protein